MSTREEVLRRDAEDLRRLGYAQQLFREMGGFSNFAVSFSIISVLTGAILLFGYGLKLAGPIVNTIGWPLVSLFTLAIAARWPSSAGRPPRHGTHSSPPLSCVGEPPGAAVTRVQADR